MTNESEHKQNGEASPASGMFGIGGTFVDLYSNTMMLRDLDFKRDMDRMIRGDLPPELFADACHEMTHTWCFTSPVGAALSLLGMRCSHLPFHAKTRREVLSPLLKLTYAMTLLRPITEGMALFAEFDAFPGCGGLIPPTTSWLLFFFGRPPVLAGIPWDEVMMSFIRSSRPGEPSVKRKENLYVQPLSCSAGGYLPGYLLVKSLWNRFRASSSPLKDADLFLVFVRSFFYEDLGLVDLLFQETDDPSEDANHVGAYLELRFRRLSKLDLPTNIALFREHARLSKLRAEFAAGDGIEISEIILRPGLENTEVQLEGARRALVGAWRELSDNLRGVPPEINLSSILRFRQRDILWMGGTVGTVEITEDRRFVFSIGETQVAEGPALSTAAIQKERGVLEAFFWTTYRYLFLVISVRTMPVGVIYLTETPPEIRKIVETGYMDRKFQLNAASDMERLLEAFLKKQSFYSDLEEFRLWINDATTRLYCEIALDEITEAKREGCKQLMMERGLWVPLGGERWAVKGLAFFSCVSACNAAQEERHELMMGAKEPLSLIEAKLRESGFPERQISVQDLSTFV